MLLKKRLFAPRSLLRSTLAASLLLTSLAFAGVGTAPVAAAGDPVIAAAGDIACDPTNAAFHGGSGTSTACRQMATSNILVEGGFAAVLPLGDEQYFCGSLWAFQNSYAQSWGRVKSISHPVVGNHEYLTSGASDCTSANTKAAGYWAYFGPAAGTKSKGWYSFNVGAWHLIALNSSCNQVGGCGAGSPQGRWLAADLASHPNACTLAYWHIPLFSSGGRANRATLPLWQLLYKAHADVVLDGHDHIYERFAPQSPSGTPDPNGIVEFTAGTGGGNHTSIVGVAANSLVRNSTSFGVLELTLHASSYSWKFVPATGSFTDSGTASCH